MKTKMIIAVVFFMSSVTAHARDVPRPRLRTGSQQLLQIVNSKHQVAKRAGRFRRAYYKKAFQSLNRNKLRAAQPSQAPAGVNSNRYRQVVFDQLEDARMRQAYRGTSDPRARFSSVVAPSGHKVTVRMWVDHTGRPVAYEGFSHDRKTGKLTRHRTVRRDDGAWKFHPESGILRVLQARLSRF